MGVWIALATVLSLAGCGQPTNAPETEPELEHSVEEPSPTPPTQSGPPDYFTAENLAQNGVDPASVRLVGSGEGIEIWEGAANGIWEGSAVQNGDPCAIWVEAWVSTAVNCVPAEEFAQRGIGIAHARTGDAHATDAYLLPEDARAGGLDIVGFTVVGERLLIRAAPAGTHTVEIPRADGAGTIDVLIMG